MENRVLVLSAEDSPEHVLKKRYKEHGANMKNVFILTPEDEGFENIKLNSPALEQIIKDIRPVVVVFDPIQTFIPPEMKMSERNAIRQCMTPLMRLADAYGVTFLLVVHTNKRGGVWGRTRIADSSDLWDAARSVLICGETGECNMRYLSHEKCNVAPLSDTILFSIDDGHFTPRGTTTKRDRDFVTALATNVRETPARDNAAAFIREYLKDGEKEVGDLEKAARANSISSATLRRAKEELRNNGVLRIYTKGVGGKGKGTRWFCCMAD